MSEPLPDWVIPPHEGFTADDFLRMSELPPHSELIDGTLVFVSPQEQWHSRIVDILRNDLDFYVPDAYVALREMAVKLGPRQMPEPDVVVITAQAFDRAESQGPSTYYHAEDVLLAVEVVSPESEERDRLTKPHKYARAGIPYFWRVERDGQSAVVHTYQLDPAGSVYGLTGIHTGVVKVPKPFPMSIELHAGRRKRGSSTGPGA